MDSKQWFRGILKTHPLSFSNSNLRKSLKESFKRSQSRRMATESEIAIRKDGFEKIANNDLEMYDLLIASFSLDFLASAM